MLSDNPFGNWLKERRKALDLTQAELADRVGCATVTLKKIETGVRRPSKQIAERMATALEIESSTQAAFVAFARGLSDTPPAALTTGAAVAAGATHHLPPQPTNFVGRGRELALMRQRFDDPACRLLTLVGPGGIGKTRLAVEAAHQHGATFAHGAHFASLALVDSADLLVFAIGSALEFSFSGKEPPVVQLINYLSDKTLLLVLDNVDHVLNCVPLLSDLLAGAPHLRLLITSRERLNLQGEWILPVEGMDYPPSAERDHPENYAAVQLFVQRAQRVQPGFMLNSDAPDVLRICRLVEGMPLAIELAAAWVRLLPCVRIADQLATSLDFLTSPLRDVPERHRSLRAVFDDSWRMLSGAEQMALAKLSVFRSAFELEAAEEVGGASLPVLASLADKSLLRADGTGRYALHELLRQYAEEQLAHMAALAGHGERAIDYLTQAAEAASQAAAHRQAAALLGEAIAIAQDVGRPALLGELRHKRGQALLKVNMWVEALPDLEAALKAAGSDNLDGRIQILLELADVDFVLHSVSVQRQRVSEALALAEAAQRTDLALVTMVKLAGVESNAGNVKEAVGSFERVLARGGDAHNDLGRALYWLGRYTDAETHLRQAVELARDDEINRIFPLQDLGLALAATGQYTEAVRVFDESLRLSREHEVRPLVARAVANMAGFHLDVFDYAGNETLAEEARELAHSAPFVLVEVSAGLDLLFNFARRQAVGRAEKLLMEVTPVVEKASGSHGWLWRLRLAQARAELALAREEWDETLRRAEIALQHSRAVGRVKYQALGLKTRAQALAALGRTPEAIVDLRNALELTRPTGDPALFLRIAAALLTVEGDEALMREAYTTAQRIRTALPNDEMRQIFQASEPVQQITRLFE